MEPIYVGDLIPSIASSKKIIEKYDKDIKEGEFYEEPIGIYFISQIGKYAYYKNNFCLGRLDYRVA